MFTRGYINIPILSENDHFMHHWNHWIKHVPEHSQKKWIYAWSQHHWINKAGTVIPILSELSDSWSQHLSTSMKKIAGTLLDGWETPFVALWNAPNRSLHSPLDRCSHKTTWIRRLMGELGELTQLIIYSSWLILEIPQKFLHKSHRSRGVLWRAKLQLWESTESEEFLLGLVHLVTGWVGGTPMTLGFMGDEMINHLGTGGFDMLWPWYHRVFEA